MYEAGRFTAASADASLAPCTTFSSVGSVGAATVKISCVLLSFSSDDSASDSSDSSFFYASVLLVMRYTDAPRPSL